MSEMIKRGRLSRTEWKVMNACWALGRATARQVHESLNDRERDYRTVKTLLDRVAAKGYLEVEKLGPLCLYRPAVGHKEALAGAIRDFVGTVLDDRLAPLFLHLGENEELSDEELEAARRMLKEQGDKPQ
ncbi:MAG TPA: BlaI/MecI/CopY family transcriptional regulator [Thermoanaerobaculia bacterium]|nr:BlaI/MecI/CopY family transcriptional regulator [Thermoanaerobaculia bacterium]